MFSVRFWGVRGSIPCPGPDTVIFGGNTSCLEIRADEKLVIVDLGTGLRSLGGWLRENDQEKYGKIDADIFITHTHWDHIMGFPMFAPIYHKETNLRITGPLSYEEDSLKQIIEHQLSYRYWPVRATELAAHIEYRQINETTLDLGNGLTVTGKYLNHPVSCMGYRFNYSGKSIAAVFDHEPFRNLFSAGPEEDGYDEQAAKEGEIAAAEENAKIADFLKGTDILIHDAQYTHDEYPRHVGWGHASCEHALKSAEAAGSGKLVFFHHDPVHTDSRLEEIEKSYANSKTAQIIMAREGMVLQA